MATAKTATKESKVKKAATKTATKTATKAATKEAKGKKANLNITSDRVEIPRLVEERLMIFIVGTSPYVPHRLSTDVLKVFAGPRGSKANGTSKAAAKAEGNGGIITLNSYSHPEMFKEFQESLYIKRRETGETYFTLPAGGVKGAIEFVLPHFPGVASKNSLNRLVHLITDYKKAQPEVELFGIPRMWTTNVTVGPWNSRSPDVRTRAIFPEWAACFCIGYQAPYTKETILNIIHNAGHMAGLGDGRAETGGNGKFNAGTFELVNESEFYRLTCVKYGKKAAQIEAFNDPHLFDRDTEEVYTHNLATLRQHNLLSKVAYVKRHLPPAA